VSYWHPGPEGTAPPSTGPGTAPAYCVAPPPGGLAAGAGIAVARPETTSLSMSCGTRAQDLHPGDPDGAQSLRSSLWINHLPNGNCELLVLLVMRTTGGLTQRHFDSQPRRLSCIHSGLEPHCRTSRHARPQPTPSPRYCTPTSLLDTANFTHYRYCNCGTAHGGP